MALNEIADLISSVLELYKKNRVDGDTPEVARLADQLVAFATRHSLENELGQLREAHLPTRSNQRMEIDDANAIIRHLLSLQSRFVEDRFSIKTILHPDISRVAEPRMAAGQYADAVESAFKELNNAVKEKVRSRLDKELDGSSLMQCVFSSENPILMVEENLDTQTNKDTQKGYLAMFSGAMSAIRNPKAHTNMTIGKNDAVRKLVFASMLMYKLDSSHLVVNQR